MSFQNNGKLIIYCKSKEEFEANQKIFIARKAAENSCRFFLCRFVGFGHGYIEKNMVLFVDECEVNMADTLTTNKK